METLKDILRRVRAAWVMTMWVALAAGLVRLIFSPGTEPLLPAACLLVFSTLAWAPLLTNWRLPLRIAPAALGAVMMPVSLVMAFAPANEFTYGAPYMFGVGVAAALAIYLASFILGPLFRRA